MFLQRDPHANAGEGRGSLQVEGEYREVTSGTGGSSIKDLAQAVHILACRPNSKDDCTAHFMSSTHSLMTVRRLQKFLTIDAFRITTAMAASIWPTNRVFYGDYKHVLSCHSPSIRPSKSSKEQRGSIRP
jgi:hypothetical protein